MKIVILNTFERTGGAAVAASRLRESLRAEGEDVTMVVRDKQSASKLVIGLNHSSLQRLLNKCNFVWERLVIFIYNRCSKKDLFAVSLANTGCKLSRLSVLQEADIIHIHWINQGFLSINEIQAIGKLGKPIVWTMHDMWPCTGICHHARECNGYYSDCATCPFTASSTLAASTLAKKKHIWEKLNVTFVTCSKWLQERTSHSVLMTNKEVLSIPNPIDTLKFAPMDQPSCREHFRLPVEKALLLFGAVKASDKRKGIDYMKAAVQLLVDKHPEWKEKLELVIFGKSDREMQELFPVKVHQIPYITSEQEMIQLYNTADLYITSSLEENLPNTIMEAMSCGVPCAGFNIGGIPEMIDHLENGYVAGYKSANDLAEGIHQLLHHADFSQLKQKARNKVIQSYSFASVAKRYIELYTQLIQKR